jgi:formate dehydrogenase major subunit
MLKKRVAAPTKRLPFHSASVESRQLSRRKFLQRSGLTASALAGVGFLPPVFTRATAADRRSGTETTIKRNVCTHCSVGCTVIAEVQNGVWTGQEPAWESPINRGAHCAKGAAIREIVHGDRRLRYPLKLTGGQWQRLSWEQAIDEIAAKMLLVRRRTRSI